MQLLQNPTSFAIYASIIAIIILPFANSSQEHFTNKTNFSHASSNNSVHKKMVKVSPKLQGQITIHGILLWASMGFLMPVGILTIRKSHREECRRRVQILLYVHSASQMLAVLLCTAGAVLSVKNFNNSFNNHHQRIGVGLYGMVWLQALMGFLRPHRGCRGRRAWFFVHWMLGTAVSFLGIVNIYTGLQAYHEKTSRGIKVWTIIFSVEVSLLALFYLLHDKWAYVQQQGVIMGDEQGAPKDSTLETH